MNLITYNTQNGIARLAMERAEKKNALTLAMYTAMAEHLEAVNADKSARVVMITGVPGTFSAGNDIQDFISSASQGALGEPILRFLRALVRCEKPLLAMVDGVAVGVGTTMLLHCDYVLVSERSVFSTPFVDLGLVPEAGSSLLMPRIIGRHHAFEFLALGRRWDAKKALSLGLVNEVAREDEIEARAQDIAREIAGKPPKALALTRRLLRGDPAETLARIDEEAEHFKACLTGAEAMQAFSNFMTRKR